jgi:hydroxymethylpyrimidine pyrophosphatase-like HAD family hydrolase
VRYTALACDYDGTIAIDGRVPRHVLAALNRVAASGRTLTLVTGRMLDELIPLFPEIELFDRVIAEDGGVIYNPDTGEVRRLADPPSVALIAELQEAGVTPLSIGQVILGTWRPNETAAIEALRSVGLEHQIIFNKDAIMIVPPGVNKATGLNIALDELEISLRNTVAIGDAQNDHSFLRACEFAVAVSDAVPVIREEADWVTSGAAGVGVVELIDQLLVDDLKSCECGQRHAGVRLGRAPDGSPLYVAPNRENVLLVGPSGSGKSRALLGIVERAVELGYQVCVIDPEGDYSDLKMLVTVGDEHASPGVAEICGILREPHVNLRVNLVALPFESRPAFLHNFYQRLYDLRHRTGRPHLLLIDEAHHLVPVSANQHVHAVAKLPVSAFVLATVHPSFVARPMLDAVDVVVGLGVVPQDIIEGFCHATDRPMPVIDCLGSGEDDALYWDLRGDSPPTWLCLDPCRTQHIRHRRKYAVGDLGLLRSFYFRGPEGKLNTRAENLITFMELAKEIDDETWLFHLRRGDYSRWIAEVIRDQFCARAIRRIEVELWLTPDQTRERVVDIISNRYTLPA